MKLFIKFKKNKVHHKSLIYKYYSFYNLMQESQQSRESHVMQISCRLLVIDVLYIRLELFQLDRLSRSGCFDVA